MFRRPDIAIRSAIGAIDPYPELVVSSYLQGIFLGQEESGELVWKSTDRRSVITRESARVRKRVQQHRNKSQLLISSDTRFEEVVDGCQRMVQWDRETDPFYKLHEQLFQLGYVTSLEACDGDRLVAGIWGLQIGRTYSVISMFHSENHAGSILFTYLIDRLMSGELDMIECGFMKPHFESFGARAIGHQEFTERVVRGLR